MSGIAGIVWKRAPSDSTAAIGKMLGQIAARGGEESKAFCEQAVLGKTVHPTGSTRFSSSPLVCRLSKFSLVADARIDNRPELCDTLLANRKLSKITDDQLILQAYKKWGAETPKRLIGDFAFAVWDEQNRKLFCCRDRFGARPFFYLDTPLFFAFSSEIKSLLVFRRQSFSINSTTLAAYILRTVHDPRHTFYNEVSRLLPASTLEVSCENIQEIQYWSPFSVPPVTFAKETDYARAFQAIFTEAVRCRVSGQLPVGAALSGGLDSSSIVSTAQDILKKEGRALQTYSVVFSGLSQDQLRLTDERRYRLAMLAGGEIKACEIETDGSSIFASLAEEIEWLDGPFFNPNLYIHRAMYEKAALDGVGVMLDGIDGDTVVSHGYELLPQLLLTGHWRHMAREILAIKEVSQSRQSFLRLLAGYGIKPLVDRVCHVEPILRLTERRRINAFFARDFIRKNNIPKKVSMSGLSALPLVNARRNHQAAMALPYLMFALESANAASIRYGIEERYPFLDTRVVEFCLGVPADQKFKNGWSRMLLRSAMVDRLPPLVLNRLSKANLSPCFHQQTKEHGRELLTEAMEKIKNRGPDIFSLQYFQKILQSQRGVQGNLDLYTLVSLAKWLDANRK